MRKKAKNRLLARAARNSVRVFSVTYRAATARERSAAGLFPQPARLARWIRYNTGAKESERTVRNRCVWTGAAAMLVLAGCGAKRAADPAAPLYGAWGFDIAGEDQAT